MRVSHAPEGWECLFCRLIAGGETQWATRSQLVFDDEHTTAFVASRWWPSNPGHVIVLPNRHVENVYEFPTELAGPIMDTVRRVAVAMKRTYGCEGISTRQHNEPAGDQDVWHFHQHVIPRWTGDQLYQRHDERAVADPADVEQRSVLLREALRSLQ